MITKIITIGGGENGRFLSDGTRTAYETEIIDKEIVQLTNKRNPNFLFLGHALNFSEEFEESYYNVMKNIYENKFNCNCKILKAKDLNDINKVKELIDWSDIIYEGGGETTSMINLWYNKGFDRVLFEAWQDGKVISGISAGAVCWFHSCNSDFINKDSDQTGFKEVNCLNWINLFITPHCNEVGRKESTKIQLKKNNLIGILLSNCCAIEIIDNKFRIIKSSNNAYALKGYWKDDEYFLEKIDNFDTYSNLSELLKK